MASEGPCSQLSSPQQDPWSLSQRKTKGQQLKGQIVSEFFISGLQKGPAERGHVKKCQKSSKSVKKFFDTFQQFSRRAKNVKNRQKVSKSFSTLFDNFRAAPFFRPLLGGSDFIKGSDERSGSSTRKPSCRLSYGRKSGAKCHWVRDPPKNIHQKKAQHMHHESRNNHESDIRTVFLAVPIQCNMNPCGSR